MLGKRLFSLAANFFVNCRFSRGAGRQSMGFGGGHFRTFSRPPPGIARQGSGDMHAGAPSGGSVCAGGEVSQGEGPIEPRERRNGIDGVCAVALAS